MQDDRHERISPHLQRFDRIVRERIKDLISDEIIEMHRRGPSGPHDDLMERILNYFRRAPVAGKYAILTVKPFSKYRIVKLSGIRGVGPVPADDMLYNSEEYAQHGVFLLRVKDLLNADEVKV